MAVDTEYAIRHSLTRAYERDLGAGGELALTMQALARSDRDRLVYFDGSRVVDNFDVQRLFHSGDDIERLVIEVAQGSPTLKPAIGYVLTDLQARPEPSAWLLDQEGNVIDPARSRRPFLGAFGVALRPVEVSRWTPTQRFEVAVGDARRLIVR